MVLHRHRAGFTMLEMLVVISIFIVIAGLSFPPLSRFYTSQQVVDTRNQVVEAVRTAQARSMAQVRGMSHGVFFEQHQFTLFQGPSFANRSTTLDIVFRVTESIDLTATFPESQILFLRGQQMPQATGTIMISHVNGRADQVQVFENGRVE